MSAVASARTSSKWLTSIQPRRDRVLTLICIPHAGGGASSFHHWRKYLPERVELRVVQLPGREERWREPLRRRMEDVCEELADAVQLEVTEPFGLFGHSLGALIAFELVRSLRRRIAALPVRLFVSARSAPDVPLSTAAHLLSDHDLRATIRSFGGTGTALLEDGDFGGALLNVIRADFELSETYVHASEPVLDIPVSAYGAEMDTLVRPQQIGGWCRHARDCSVRMFDGDHFYVRTQARRVIHSILEELVNDQRKAGASAGSVSR